MWACSPLRSVTFVPAGTTEASTSRARVTCSFVVMFQYNSRRFPGQRGSKINNWDPPLWRLTVFRFRAHRFGLSVHGGDCGMPGQNSAFDTRRELMHTSENSELAEVLPIHSTRGHHLADLIEKGFDLRLGFALERGGENGSGGFGNGAAGTLKADVFDGIAIHQQVQTDIIATEWVVALGGA